MTVIIATPAAALSARFADILGSAGFSSEEVPDLTGLERAAAAGECGLALVDWVLVASNPRERLKRLCRASGGLRVVLLGDESVLYGPELAEAIGAGAADFLLAGAPASTLAAKLRLYADAHAATGTLRAGGLEVDRLRREVRLLRGRRWIPSEKLTPKEFDLLCAFLESPGVDLTRASLMERLWGGREGAVNTEALDKQVASLRRKLGPRGKDIRTLRGVGYRLG